MSQIDAQLIESFKKIIDKGYDVANDRTGVGTRKIFGEVIRLAVSQEDFPINKTKEIFFKGIVVELLWLMNGGHNTEYLKRHGVNYWDAWADENGNLGPVYGAQWRSWVAADDGNRHYRVDQLSRLIETIKNNPNDRRQLVSAWNVGQLAEMKLPPCHYMFQTFVRGDTLDLMMHQRSCDMFLGVPFDLVLYSLLLLILAKITNKVPGEFIWTGGDCHIYSNHKNQVDKQIHNFTYMPSKDLFKQAEIDFSPEIDFSSLESFLTSTLEHPERISLHNYTPADKIPAPVAV